MPEIFDDQPNNNEENLETPEERAFRDRIAANDEKYEIQNFDVEDTLGAYYIRRTDGSIEKWLLVGEGPQKGKFTKLGDAKGPMLKYLDIGAVQSTQDALAGEYAVQRAEVSADSSSVELEAMIDRAKVITDLGTEANEAVPVVGPNDAMIRDIPSFSSPQTAQNVTEGLAKPIESAEKIESSKYDYLRDFLPPTIRPEKTASPSKNQYDALFDKTGIDQPLVQQQPRTFGQYEPETEDDKKRKYYDRFVTEENRSAGRETLMEAARATPEIREALNKHGFATGSLEAVDAIRENPEVRFEVARVLAKKLDKLAESPYNDMGWRINDNSPNNLKSDAITGRKMLSRTYAINMALKMIGGEFSTRIEGSDPIERDKEGRVAIGQHRHAATTALMSYEQF